MEREEAAREAALVRKAARLSLPMAKRKTKRQRFSLGGPAVDTSFEEYLTGSNKHVSSDEEEEFDQENQDPEDEPGIYSVEDEKEHGNDVKSEIESIRSAPAPNTGLTKDQRHLIDKIHIHQNNTNNSTAKDIYYLLQARLILPEAPVAVTRLLCVPAILLFEQLTEAFFNAFDWGGFYSKYTLAWRTPNSVDDELPAEGKQIANIRNFDPLNASMRKPRIIRPSDLDSRKIRLMDIWHQSQHSGVRGLKMFFTYNCEGDEGECPLDAVVTFMGVADQGLQAADLGIDVVKGQQIWCIGGSGACKPEYMSENEAAEWDETNKHEWNVEFANVELETVKVREASYYCL